MNVAILITALSTVAFALILDGAGAYNSSPCQTNSDNNAYNKFVRKHILMDSINTASKTDWGKYIKKKKLCNRSFQTFIPSQDQSLAVKICNGGGIRHNINLCTSKSSILVYEISVNTYNCKVTNVASRPVYPMVACDKVSNRCRPTHYQASSPRKPQNGQICKP
ncbi:uncharacterized protein ACNS7B_018716 isoform 1-T2 [Menidia menidia]